MTEADKSALTSLKNKLEKFEQFPTVYKFKFIFKKDNRLMAIIENWFDGEVRISYNKSRNGNYTSITVDARMRDADEVIEVYRKGMETQGLIML
jgi:putative lipoic acid-binding regulatory protein